jgi:hypothetical protein
MKMALELPVGSGMLSLTLSLHHLPRRHRWQLHCTEHPPSAQPHHKHGNNELTQKHCRCYVGVRELFLCSLLIKEQSLVAAIIIHGSDRVEQRAKAADHSRASCSLPLTTKTGHSHQVYAVPLILKELYLISGLRFGLAILTYN